MASTVLLADGQQMMREGIKLILQQTGEFDVVGEADTGLDAIRLAKTLRPELVVTDCFLPGTDVLDVIREMLRHSPNIRIVLLSAQTDDEIFVAMLRNGVRTFVTKNSSSVDLLDAMRLAVRGGAYLGAPFSQTLLGRIQKGDIDAKPSVLQGLSPRERQILRMVAEGGSSKDIANVLKLELHTIRTYRKTLMKKIGVTNVAGLVRTAIQAGIWGGPGIALAVAPPSLEPEYE